MSTKLKRVYVSIPDEVLPFLLEDCKRPGIALSTKIMKILAEHYQFSVPQPMIFGRARPLRAESRHARPLVFEAPAQPVAEPASDRRESLGQGKN